MQGRGRDTRKTLHISPRKKNRVRSGRRIFQQKIQEYRRKRRYRYNPVLAGIQEIFLQIRQRNLISRGMEAVQAGMEVNLVIRLYWEIST